MEVERLKQIADERHGEYSDYTQLPFGKYKGKRLADVPDDYLRWWIEQHDRYSMSLDAQYGPQSKRQVARANLKLYDYILRRMEKPDDVSQTVETDQESNAA
jgi:uncharacterized protein (DUF3820 family)